MHYLNRLWNQLPDSFRQRHQSRLDSPPPSTHLCHYPHSHHSFTPGSMLNRIEKIDSFRKIKSNQIRIFFYESECSSCESVIKWLSSRCRTRMSLIMVSKVLPIILAKLTGRQLEALF